MPNVVLMVQIVSKAACFLVTSTLSVFCCFWLQMRFQSPYQAHFGGNISGSGLWPPSQAPFSGTVSRSAEGHYEGIDDKGAAGIVNVSIQWNPVHKNDNNDIQEDGEEEYDEEDTVWAPSHTLASNGSRNEGNEMAATYFGNISRSGLEHTGFMDLRRGEYKPVYWRTIGLLYPDQRVCDLLYPCVTCTLDQCTAGTVAKLFAQCMLPTCLSELSILGPKLSLSELLCTPWQELSRFPGRIALLECAVKQGCVATLGCGKQSLVKLAVDWRGKLVAWKTWRDESRARLAREGYGAVSNLTCQGIAQAIDLFPRIQQANTTYTYYDPGIILPFIQEVRIEHTRSGDMKSDAKSIILRCAPKFLEQVAMTMKCMYSGGLLYTDLHINQVMLLTNKTVDSAMVQSTATNATMALCPNVLITDFDDIIMRNTTGPANDVRLQDLLDEFYSQVRHLLQKLTVAGPTPP